MPIDFNDAPDQRSFDLIPKDTICAVQMKIRAGGSGEDRMLKRSKNGGCEMLDCEFVVLDGPFAGRKFWESLILNGTTEGHAKAIEISRGRLRGIIESARGIKRADESDAARKARVVSLKDFDGVPFIAKIGVEKGTAKPGGEFWPDKNCLAEAITPERKDWRAIDQRDQFVRVPEQPIKQPDWAKS